MNKVEICGINTSDLKLLSADEKMTLLKKIKDGDKNAREIFINGNLRLVLSVIKRFQNRGENPDDLFQVGCVGLIKAIDNFQLDQNVQFSTYAVPMIIGEIRRYLRDNNSIRVSRSLKDIAYKALRAKEEMIAKNQKEPTIEEIAKAIEVDRLQVIMALDSMQDPVSLFEPVYNDNSDTLYVMDQVKDQKNPIDNWMQEYTISCAVDHLHEREQNIINMRFFNGKTQTEVANEIGISQAQVSRLEKNALKKMKYLCQSTPVNSPDVIY